MDISYHQLILAVLAKMELLLVPLVVLSLLVLPDSSKLELQSLVLLVELELTFVPLPLKLLHVLLDFI
jgi:hypothetical protein